MFYFKSASFALTVACFLPFDLCADEHPSATSLLKRFDADGDGKLELKELEKALQSFSKEKLEDDTSGFKFIRVRKNKKGRAETLETSVARYQSADSNLTVDLIGAVHVADKGYYDKLNKLFREYDVVLYELVAPEGTRVPHGGGRSRHPIGQMQQGIKGILDLEFQLEHVDYGPANLVHADMSPDEFAKSMKDRGESFIQILFRMMGQAAAQQGKGSAPSDAELLLALFSRNRSLRLKQIMAAQFEDLENQMSVFQGPDGSTLISERNKKALSVLTEQIAAGKKKIGIFYGSGHMPDMSKRLQHEFKLKPVSEEWLVAWDMSGK